METPLLQKETVETATPVSEVDEAVLVADKPKEDNEYWRKKSQEQLGHLIWVFSSIAVLSIVALLLIFLVMYNNDEGTIFAYFIGRNLLLIGGSAILAKVFPLHSIENRCCTVARLKSQQDTDEHEKEAKILEKRHRDMQRASLFLVFWAVGSCLVDLSWLNDPAGPNIEELRLMTGREFTESILHDPHVVKLTTDTFEDFVEVHEISSIHYYTPWCVACKSLAPKWEGFAQQVEEEDMPIGVAKVDCEAEADLCRQQKIRNFPSIRWYHAGEPMSLLENERAVPRMRLVKGLMAKLQIPLFY